MIKEFSLKALQKAINQALSLDSTIPDKISPLQGKILEIIVAPLDVNFFMTFSAAEIILLPASKTAPDTVIHSNPLGLIRLSFLPASKARSLFNDQINISGDAELGYAVKKLFDEVDIDWEGHLAHFTGDVVAHQVGTLFRKGLDLTNQWSQSMHENFNHYFHEELKLFPPREEINDFFKDIDELVLDVERLEATINLLMAPHEIN